MAGWLFLAVTLIGALLVANDYRPFFQGPRLGFASFFVGWLEAELAVHHILWQGVATLGFIAAGALESPAGKVALGVTLLSWLALALHYARGFAVRDTMERALVEGLGPDYESEILPEVWRGFSRGVDWLAIAAPFPVRWRYPEVECVRNLRYGRAGGMNLKLDLYRRRGSASEPRPVLFYVHGGGWVIGTKDTQGLPLVHHMASLGWVCVNVNYRLSPYATFPDHLVDLKRAVQWVRKEGPAYGCDPDFIVATGGSAGGHLASLLALTSGDPELQPGFQDADTRVQGCVPIYGVYDFTPGGGLWSSRETMLFLERGVMKASYADDPVAFEKASPVHRVHTDAPPFLVVHGEADTLVPASEAHAFVDALRQTSRAPVAYAEIPGAQHAFELFPSLRSILARQGIERFLGALLSERLAARGMPDSAS
jgi:acetyl esterase/lipase